MAGRRVSTAALETSEGVRNGKRERERQIDRRPEIRLLFNVILNDNDYR